MTDPFASENETKVTLEAERTGIIEEPPFRMLVLGDWSGDAEKDSLAPRKPIVIDRDNFDEVMAKLGVRADISIGDGEIVSLEFNELDDFHPDNIFRRLDVFDKLRGLRKELNNDDTFYRAAREVRGMFELGETDPPAPTDITEEPADNLLDAILGQPSGGAPKPKPKTSGDLSNLISDLVRPHLVSVDENEKAGTVAAVDAATGSLMRAILRDKKFKELESAWRGLYFLVRRTETDTDLKIYIQDVTKNDLADDLKDAADLSRTELYKHLVTEGMEAGLESTYAVVLGNYELHANIEDIALLIRVSKIAAAANAPFISHIHPSIFGIGSFDKNPEYRDWNIPDESDRGKLWNALRGQAESRYLGIAAPRFIARLPYGQETDPAETFAFEEFDENFSNEDYVWANPCFIVGNLLANSYSNYGWAMGERLMQDVEGLPVHVYKNRGETIFKPCAEILMTEAGCDRLMNFGFMPLASFKDTDRVKLARFQSISDPVRALKGIWN
jgi:type VI secretion system protein ImpC